jgi:tetratricopeptide (TPR) repeat protein
VEDNLARPKVIPRDPAMRLLLFLIVTIRVLLTGAAEPLQRDADDKLLQSAQKKEEEGHLADAYKLIQHAEKTGPELKEHAKSLAMVIHALKSTEIYLAKDRKEYARARTALSELLPKLDPVRDAPLVDIVHKKLREAEEAGRKVADDDANAVLDKANTLLKAEKFDDAIAAYADVAGKKPGEVSEDIIQKGIKGKHQAEAEKAKAGIPSFWWDIWTTLRTGIVTISGWIFYFVVLGTVLCLVVRIPRLWSPNDGVEVSVEDLTATTADRAVQSQHLTEELTGRIKNPEDGGDGIEIDRYEDIDRGDLGSLRVRVDDLSKLDSLIQDTSPVRFGPVSFSARDLFVFLRTYLRRPYRTSLRGTLSKEKDKSTLVVERSVLGGNAELAARWEETATGPTARAEVIRAMVRRIAFEYSNFRITSNWRSYEAYSQGMDVLLTRERTANSTPPEAAAGADTAVAPAAGAAVAPATATPTPHEPSDRKALLDKACESFQRSLVFDQGNWMARFNLATVWRKLGHNDESEAQFRLLELIINIRVSTEKTGPLIAFLENNEEFPSVVCYNRAVALSKMFGPDPHFKAKRILQDLIESYESAKSKNGIRVYWLSRSALSALHVILMEEDETREHWDEFFEAIKNDQSWVEELCTNAIVDWQTYTMVRAVILNAYGRAQFLKGSYPVASRILSEVISTMPDFVDAYVNYADACLATKQENMVNRVERAQEILQKAIKLSPSHERAHYLLAKVYDSTQHYDYALKELDKAGPRPRHDALRAEILLKQDKPDEALKALQKSISLFSKPDYRFVRYIKLLTRNSADGSPPSEEHLRMAMDAAVSLHKNGVKRSYREDGEKLLGELKSLAVRVTEYSSRESPTSVTVSSTLEKPESDTQSSSVEEPASVTESSSLEAPTSVTESSPVKEPASVTETSLPAKPKSTTGEVN